MQRQRLSIVIVGRSASDPEMPNTDMAALKKIKEKNIPVMYAETDSQDVTLELKHQGNPLSRELTHYLMQNKIFYQGIGLPLKEHYRLGSIEDVEEYLDTLISHLSTMASNIFNLALPKLPKGGIIYLNTGTIMARSLTAMILQHFEKTSSLNETFYLRVLTAKISKATEENEMEEILIDRLPEGIILVREDKESEVFTAPELDNLIDNAIREVTRRASDPKLFSPTFQTSATQCDAPKPGNP